MNNINSFGNSKSYLPQNNDENLTNYFLLDYYDNISHIEEIKNFKNNKHSIFLNFKVNNKDKQCIYDRRNFNNKYFFIGIISQEDPNKSVGVLLPKYNNFNHISLPNQIINEIKRFNYGKGLGFSLGNNNFWRSDYQLQEIDANFEMKNKFDKIFKIIINPQTNNSNNSNNFNNRTEIINQRNNFNNFNSSDYNYNNNTSINLVGNNNQNNNLIETSNSRYLQNNYLNSNNHTFINNRNNNCNNMMNNNYYINDSQSNNNNNYYNSSNNNMNGTYNQNNNNQIMNNSNIQQNQMNQSYHFPLKGLNNIGSTCYMNATLQCLLHISELVYYFLTEYQKDSPSLRKKNQDIESKGNISEAFFQIIKGVLSDDNPKFNGIGALNMKTQTGIAGKHFRYGSSYLDSYNKSFSPDYFKKVLGYYNPQFRRFEANDSKDLILYLLQTMHEELNYFGDNPQGYYWQPNQLDMVQTFMYFNQTYNMHNFSIISRLFYGTYINSTKCRECGKTIYNFQKFEFISFGMFDYNRKTFNIYDGFRDNEKPQDLKGDNKFYCNFCKKLCDAKICSRIIQAPMKLLINIDYGKNKRFQPTNIEFPEIIDISKFIFLCQGNARYRIVGVCTHFGYSGSFGHYIAYCKNRNTGKWYKFNDSNFGECSDKEINSGSPYLLLYETIV